MVIWIVLGFTSVVIALAIWLDRNPDKNKLAEKIEHNDRRTQAFEEVSRYHDM
ncbi:hypothetical protein LCM20_15890 [Halobacillus litoralis]|uniref:hypothetical protein n=1 Tax=Halobacillus litoralis TaxID=45668 RepID=UPI001CD3DC42|nr:hypothetical protein [Halobacillus litoralis]MCA0972089.1 hypothetical protein [Halobacillus litoralis]